MRRFAVLLPISLILAACNDDPEIRATNASVEDVAEQVREATADEEFIRPGKWVSQVRFEEMSAPDIPRSAERQVNELLDEAQTFESCLSEEQAKQPRGALFTNAGEQCRYENFTMGNGKIDATMKCSQNGATQTTRMEGDYSPDSYQLRMTSSVDNLMGGEAGEMRVRMRIDSKRVGECQPETDVPNRGQEQ